MGPMAKGPGPWRTDMYNSGADGTHGRNRRRYLKLCQPMGTWLPIGGNEDFGTSPFLGSSSDKSTPAPTLDNGHAGDKEQ